MVVVDDSPIFRSGLKAILEGFGIDVLGEAGTAEGAVALAEGQLPDVVLMDAGVAAAWGGEALGAVLATHRTQVVVLAATRDERALLDALGAGACGCVLKDDPIDEVLAAIRAAARGEFHVSLPIAGGLVRRLRTADTTGREAALTPRELDVLRLVARGWDNARIAGTLFIGHGTVKHHISSILEKLHVENRVQAAVFAAREGLLDS